MLSTLVKTHGRRWNLWRCYTHGYTNHAPPAVARTPAAQMPCRGLGVWLVHVVAEVLRVRFTASTTWGVDDVDSRHWVQPAVRPRPTQGFAPPLACRSIACASNPAERRCPHHWPSPRHRSDRQPHLGASLLNGTAQYPAPRSRGPLPVDDRRSLRLSRRRRGTVAQESPRVSHETVKV
jgi:hypothetical protein